MNSSGFSIIRWQSSGNLVALRSDFTTGGPIVRFGTKCPSMMSTWMTLPPALARGAHLLAQPGKISRKNRRCQFDHARSIKMVELSDEA